MQQLFPVAISEHEPKYHTRLLLRERVLQRKRHAEQRARPIPGPCDFNDTLTDNALPTRATP